MDNVKSKISVIMPAFNSADYIKEAIESVINQTYRNFELIIVNDGSNDNTENIVRSFVEKDSRIKLINQENRGVAMARNLALASASGEWICILDSDDCLAPKTFEIFMNDEQINEIDLFDSGIMNFTKTENWPASICYSKDTLQSSDKFKEKLLINIFRSKSMPRNVLIRRSIIFDNNILYDTRYSILEDVDFIFELLLKARCVKIYCEELYKYRVVDSSLTHKINSVALNRNVVFFENSIEKYKYRDNKIYRFCKAWYLRSIIAYYFALLSEVPCDSPILKELKEKIRYTKPCFSYLKIRDIFIICFVKKSPIALDYKLKHR